MKKYLILFSLLVAGIVTAESVTVGTNQVILLPKRTSGSWKAWAGNTNAYAFGEYVSYQQRNYVVTGAGTATNNPPTHGSGESTYDGVTYRYIESGLRRGAFAVNDSTNVCYLSELGRDAVVNSGIRINANGGGIVLEEGDNYEIRAIAASTNNNFTVSDR